MNENKAPMMSSMEHSSGTKEDEPIVDEAKQALARATGQAREQLGDRVESKKGQAVEAMDGLARALRQANLEPGPVPAIANRAATMIERVAQAVDRRSLRDLRNDVEDYARREPAIFIAGAFAVGLFAARFLRSSSVPESREGAFARIRKAGQKLESAAGIDTGRERGTEIESPAHTRLPGEH